MQQKNDICLKCGICCHYIFEGKLKPCKHLGKDNLCKIYDTRLGTRIDKNMRCIPRRLSSFDYPGCPYNTDKPLFIYTKDNLGDLIHEKKRN